MNTEKQRARQAVLADTRLFNADKIVLLSMVESAPRRADGSYVFSQPHPAWSFSIDTPPRTLVASLGKLRDGGYITQLSKKYARQHVWEVNIADIIDGALSPRRRGIHEVNHYDFGEEATNG